MRLLKQKKCGCRRRVAVVEVRCRFKAKVKTTEFMYLPPNSACKLKLRNITSQQNNKSLMDAWAFYYFASFSPQNRSKNQTQ